MEIKSMHIDSEEFAGINGVESKKYNINRGVGQGCAKSP